jgi:flagellar hook-associated protein 3 FlgL
MSSRISTDQLFSSARNAIAKAREKEVASSEKASSQKQIERPSDNPGGYVQAANIKEDVAQKDGIARNAALASRMLSVTESVLGQIQESVQRAHDLAISASGTAASEQTRVNLLAEAKTLVESTIRTLNTRFAGRTLMGGYKTQTPAFNEAGDYIGGGEEFRIEIGKGLIVPVNIAAESVIKGKGVKDGVDIPAVLNRLVSGLSANDSNIVQGTLDELMRAGEQLNVGRSQIGARMSEIERVTNAHETDKLESLAIVANIEEADAFKAFSDLTRDQTVLKAAISTGEKLMAEDPASILFR